MENKAGKMSGIGVLRVVCAKIRTRDLMFVGHGTPWKGSDLGKRNILPSDSRDVHTFS